MVITITMKNVIKRGEIYYFRIGVPKDCRDSVGKREILLSLKTKNADEVASLAKPLIDEWKQKFKDIRASSTTSPIIKSKTDDTVADFKKKLDAHIAEHLTDYLERQNEEELIETCEWLMECMEIIKKNDGCSIDLSGELGITYPLSGQKSPGMTRKFNKVVIGLLEKICLQINEEIGRDLTREIAEKYEMDLLLVNSSTDSSAVARVSQPAKEVDIAEIMKLMVTAKNTAKKNREMIANEVMYLQEWLGGKSDITQFTKADLVDYIQTCLPYSPKNMRKKPEYDGKSLAECVAMVKNDPIKCIPISYRTCENRLVGLQSVFNYAKKQLALVPVNVAMGVSIPKVRLSSNKIRSYTSDELDTMWAKLKDFSAVNYKYPERYWVTVLALYHGFRVNEICSLHLGDIYQDEDDIWVMDVKEDGGKKTVKTASSVRIVPVHPFVLDTLDLMGFVEERKCKGVKDDLLFPNLTYTDTQGYAKKISVWFRQWKKTWLPVECQHKNFHSLRHTFTQQAQNQAKMSDRCNQEITGHSIGGVSSVHLGYSGRLKPKDVLEELKKVQYGWE